MTLLRQIRNVQVNSSVARAMLGCYYADGKVYTIPFGPLRGFKLRYHQRINYHAMLGLWEPENFRYLSKLLIHGGLLRPDSVVCDVGANIGLFSLWLSRRCVPAGRVYAFEAAPDTFETLQDTISLNGASNIHLEHRACTNRCGPVEFFIGFHHHVSSLNADWAAGERGSARAVVVDGITLDEFFYGAEPHPAPAFIKMDIEGGGVYALAGCERCVQKGRPFFLMESHTPAEDQSISDLITRHAYQAFRITNQKWVTVPTAVHPNPDGVWGTLFLCPAERYASVAAILE